MIIDEQTIGFQGRHKDKLRINFKDVGDGFQSGNACDCGYTYSFIYRNDDIPDSKHYLCETIERVICLLKRLNTERNYVYMDNSYNNGKLYKAAYAENKLICGVAMTYERVVPYEFIQQEVNIKKNRTR